MVCLTTLPVRMWNFVPYITKMTFLSIKWFGGYLNAIYPSTHVTTYQHQFRIGPMLSVLNPFRDNSSTLWLAHRETLFSLESAHLFSYILFHLIGSHVRRLSSQIKRLSPFRSQGTRLPWAISILDITQAQYLINNLTRDNTSIMGDQELDGKYDV